MSKNPQKDTASKPLAELLRPERVEDFIGQKHLLGDEAPLRKMIASDRLYSFVLWGPPGCGKTTLAKIIAAHTQSEFISISAVSSGVKEIREIIDRAKENTKYFKKTILFIDEIHRFNKSQQDALLHCVETGELTLIGATTENPSFEVITPLLSRCKVYVLEPLGEEELNIMLQKGVAHLEKRDGIKIEVEDAQNLIFYSGGDGRILLNSLEMALELSPPAKDGVKTITKQAVKDTFQKKAAAYDQAGEQHYNIISAFIKSIRGSDPDAAVYWMARMLEGGEDPLFIARRMIILASEDIGNADPYGLTLATSCFTACNYIGMPEARIILSQTATYLASVPKSNAAVVAIDLAAGDARGLGDLPVPLHLRNRPTKLMKDLGYGKDYKYAHSYEKNFADQRYFPEKMDEKVYYDPTENGREKKLKEALKQLWPKRRKT